MAKEDQSSSQRQFALSVIGIFGLCEVGTVRRQIFNQVPEG